MRMVAKAFRWTLLAPAFVLPLLYTGGLMYPLMSPKTFALRGLALTAAALFLYLVFSGERFFWSRLSRWQFWIPGALLAVAYAASFLGVDFYHSFWSTFERGDGLLTLSACVGFFYLIVLSADRDFVRSLLKLVAWTGSIVALYAVLQWMHAPFLVTASGRIGGTLGNAAFLASYLGMTFFVTVMLAREAAGTARKQLSAGAMLQIAAILISATRGTMLALMVVGTAILAYHALRGEGRAKKYSRNGLAVLIVVTVLFIAFRGALVHVPIAPIQRLASISLADATVSSRVFIVTHMFGEAGKRPLGYGAEHVNVLFNQVYDPSAIGEEWFDRSHNAYLDYLVQFGWFGLACFLALLFAFVSGARRLWREGNQYGPYLLAALGVYAVQNLFVFDTGVTLWLLFVLGAVTLIAPQESSAATPMFAPSKAAAYLSGGLVLLLLIPVVIQPLRANRSAFVAYLYHVADVQKANARAEEGLALGTYADLEFGYNAYFMYTQEQYNMLSGSERVAAYQSAYSILKHNYQKYTYDARTLTYLAHVLSLPPPEVKPDRGLLSEVLAKAIEASPKRAQAWYILANLSIGDANQYPPGSAGRLAGYRAANDILSTYIERVPELAEPHFVLAELQTAQGNEEAAALEAARGKALFTGDSSTARRAAGYAVNHENWEDAYYFMGVLARSPSATTAEVYDYAKLAYILDRKDESLEIVQRLRSADPAILETDPDFLAAITSYESR